MTEPKFEEASAPKAFGLQSAANLLKKFVWERDQFHRAIAPDNYRYPDVTPIYLAYNCAITAWHLIDWVWVDASDAQRAKLAETYRFEKSEGRAAFRRALLELKPELAACHDIANGSKHFELTRPKSDVKVESGFAVVVSPGGSGLQPGDYLLTLHIWLPNNNMSAKVFFDKLLAFWHGVLQLHGMFDDAQELIDVIPTPPPFRFES